LTRVIAKTEISAREMGPRAHVKESELRDPYSRDR